MPNYGKTNTTGRSSRKFSSRDQKVFGPPRDEFWTWVAIDLIASPAWQGMSINTRRLIDRLRIEHQSHAGRENGELIATYAQLVDFGLTREAIPAAIAEAEAFDLIKVERRAIKMPSYFTLTFYATRDAVPPTNDWRRVTDEDVKAYKKDRRERKFSKKFWKHKKKNPSTESRTNPVRISEPV